VDAIPSETNAELIALIQRTSFNQVIATHEDDLSAG
jgi:hypothetical protein